MGVEELCPGNNPITEELFLRVEDVSDAGSIVLCAHGEDMHLVELRDLLQELAGIGPQATVVDHGVAWQTKPVHILGEGRSTCVMYRYCN